ncbi:MAG TPA: oligosaccharide flippase family protein [Patescibacteria group bacterium]
MKKHIQTIIKHPLISNSAIIVGGGLLANLFNFFFNLFMSRNLSVANYGTLASIVSMLSLFILLTESFMPTIVHFSAGYFANKEFSLVRGVFFKFTKITLVLGLLLLVLIIIFAKQIGSFFNIHEVNIIYLASFIVFLSFVNVVNKGLLQAKLAFGYISFITFLGTLFKFLLGVLFVLLGFKVFGALLAFVLSFILPYLATFLPLRIIFVGKVAEPKNISSMQVFTYGGPATISILALTFFVTTDIIMVKHFFNPTQAGIYAGLSLVGRVIFFLSAPISTVMFPLVVHKRAKNEAYHNIFMLSLLLVFLPSLAMTIFYFLFPSFSISFFLKNKSYLTVAPMLGYFGIFVTLYALLSVLTNFFLSIKKTAVAIPLVLSALLQAVLIWIFHATIFEVIMVSTFSIGLPVAILLVYYFSIHVKKH